MNIQTDKFLENFNVIDFHKVRDHPNILIAANFWEEERFRAAKICYKFMRMIDDLIDDHKTKNKFITANEKKIFETNINDWLKRIITPKECDPLQQELKEAIDKFKIPLWPMESFAKSMIYDIQSVIFKKIKLIILITLQTN
ncbi:MAG: hypothetical protein NT092_10330 [Bacteroidia bacterium]|nr:hypothetical protein [Bacteroidia bacterium]